jgi:integrase
VRDIFLFSCYTGLSYIDVYRLQSADIVSGIDGKKWIMTTRKKTDSPIRLPLLPYALKILKRYKTYPKCLDNGTALPVLTNQKMNSYLKEIADTCGIKKRNLLFISPGILCHNDNAQ